MKKIILLCSFIFTLNLCKAQVDAPPPPQQEQEELERKEAFQNSSTKITLRNNTGKEIYACFVCYDKSESSWTSRGWYKISAYQSKTLPLGDYSGPIYIHGETMGSFTNTSWGDKWKFCIDASKPFAILNADKIDCSKKVGFYKYNVSIGMNKWTFNP